MHFDKEHLEPFFEKYKSIYTNNEQLNSNIFKNKFRNTNGNNSNSSDFISYTQNDNSLFRLFKDLYPNRTEFIVDVILYVVLVVNILTILFFTIVKNVEKEIIQNQINNLLDSTLIDENTVSENILYEQQYKLVKQNLIAKINSIPVNQNEEDKIKKHNDEIFKNSMIFLVIINVIGTICLVFLWRYQNFDILYYLKKNFVLGIFVLLTEILFLYVISKNYMYIDKKYIMKILQQKITK